MVGKLPYCYMAVVHRQHLWARRVAGLRSHNEIEVRKCLPVGIRTQASLHAAFLEQPEIAATLESAQV